MTNDATTANPAPRRNIRTYGLMGAIAALLATIERANEQKEETETEFNVKNVGRIEVLHQPGHPTHKLRFRLTRKDEEKPSKVVWANYLTVNTQLPKFISELDGEEGVKERTFPTLNAKHVPIPRKAAAPTTDGDGDGGTVETEPGETQAVQAEEVTV